MKHCISRAVGRTASTDCTRRKHGRNTLSRQTKKTMDQRHRRLDGVQVHSAKGNVSGRRAMEEEDTGILSCCRQPSEEEGRLERERCRDVDAKIIIRVTIIIQTFPTYTKSELILNRRHQQSVGGQRW